MRWLMAWAVWLAIFVATSHFFPHEGWIGFAFFGAGVFASTIVDLIHEYWGK